MTQETKHTTGPWEFKKDPHTTGSYDVFCDGLRLAIVTSGPAQFTEPKYGCPSYIGCQGEANARLIAAAPELLAALIELEQLVAAHIPDEAENWARNARAAIAKAKGAA